MDEDGRQVRAGGSGPEPPSLVLRFPADSKLLGLTRELATRASQLAGFDEETSGGIGRAVERAATRLAQDQRGERSGAELELRLEDRGRELSLEVRHGGVDPSGRGRPPKGSRPVRAEAEGADQMLELRPSPGGDAYRLVLRKA